MDGRMQEVSKRKAKGNHNICSGPKTRLILLLCSTVSSVVQFPLNIMHLSASEWTAIEQIQRKNPIYNIQILAR